MPNAKQTAHKAKRRKFIDDYKAARGCISCDETDPICLDLDHRPDEKKVMHVAAMVSTGQSFEKLIAELLKCDVRCANCHRKITRARTQEKRAGIAQR